MKVRVRWCGEESILALGGIPVSPGDVIEIPEEAVDYLAFPDRWEIVTAEGE